MQGRQKVLAENAQIEAQNSQGFHPFGIGKQEFKTWGVGDPNKTKDSSGFGSDKYQLFQDPTYKSLAWINAGMNAFTSIATLMNAFEARKLAREEFE